MFFLLAGIILVLAIIPGTIELLWLTTGALLPYKSSLKKSIDKLPTVVIIPAHNESQCIVEAIRTIKNCTGSFEVIVIADNCTDNTCELSKKEKARVIVRVDPMHMGKGYALKYAFDFLLKENFEIFVVIDADTQVLPNFIEVIQTEIGKGAEAIQVRYALLNPNSSMRERFLNIAFTAFNYLRPKGRQGWGLSAGILGNGFALTKKTLQDIPYNTYSIVEDLTYHLLLVKAGKKVSFTDATAVFAPSPSSYQGASTQRTRWEGGRLRAIWEEVPKLVKEIIRGNTRLVEPLLDLLTLPLIYHAALVGLLFFFFQNIALFATLVILFYVGVAFKLANGTIYDAFALLLTPFYLIWKLCLLPKTLISSRKNSAWTRTKRD